MVADQRLRGADVLGQMGDTQLLGGQQLDDAPAQRVSERPGEVDRHASELADATGGAATVAIQIK